MNIKVKNNILSIILFFLIIYFSLTILDLLFPFKISTKKKPIHVIETYNIFNIFESNHKKCILFDTKYSCRNFDSSFQNTQGSCCIIGNGSSALNTTAGNEIDNFTYVIRLYDYKIEEYYKYIGKKTTHWITGLGRQSESREIKTKINIMICTPYFENKHIVKKMYNLKVFNHDFHSMDNYILNFDYLTQLIQGLELPNEIIEKIKKKTSFRPTTGLCSIVMALQIFPCIYAKGFDCFRNETEQSNHYFHRKTKHSPNIHDFDIEYAIIQYLINNNKIKVI